jgi:small subunit ribosomal protein S26
MFFRRLDRIPRFLFNCRTKTKQSPEERSRLVEYRKKVSQRRKEFYEEWLSASKERQTAPGSKLTVEHEARKKEKAAFEANRLENERMANLREEKAVVEARKQALLKKQKAEIYGQKVAKLQELRQAIVFEQKEKGKDFITIDTLDAKIEEALDNPKDYNFAISQTGEILTTPPSRPHLLPVQGW